MSELSPVCALKDPIEFEQGDEPKARVNFLVPVHAASRLDPAFHEVTTRLEFSPAQGIMEAMRCSTCRINTKVRLFWAEFPLVPFAI